jgi:hypothetical protein
LLTGANKSVPCRRKFLLAGALLMLVSQASGSTLFDDSTVLELDLTGPLSSVFKDRKERTEQSFMLRADDVEHSVKVRLRGVNRVRACSFPPLRIKFNKNSTEGTVFAGQHKLKLVTHCNNHKSSNASLLNEYAAYKIFNVISEIGYRVRLVRITYTDTDGKLKDGPIERYGFLIESAEGLAGRSGAQSVETTGVYLSSLNARQAASVYIFQYLIGNTDWSLVTSETKDFCCHNGHLYDVDSELYYVPYDFDRAGLVNAHYARPDPALGIARNTQRVYRGYCISKEALTEALGAIKARQDEITGVLHDVPGLSQKEKSVSIKYLNGFFAKADDEKKLIKSFDRRCL